MTPRVFASGGKERHGHISKTGPRDMRWVLQQAAWVAIRCDDSIKRRWLKIAAAPARKRPPWRSLVNCWSRCGRWRDATRPIDRGSHGPRRRPKKTIEQ